MNANEEKKLLSEEVSEKMMKNISQKIWLPGDRLPTEKELMSMYSVSRITVREATRHLVSLGLLRTVQGSGTYVCEYNSNQFIQPVTTSMYLATTSREDILNILNVRYLEVIIAGQAAAQSTPEGVAKLAEIQKRMEQTPYTIKNHAEVDAEFHMQICNMTNNPYMMQVCKAIYSGLEYVMPTISKIMKSEKAVYYHNKLIDTIRHHYVTEAKATMEEHLRVTIEAVQSVPEDSDIFLKSDH